jgi:hypothetical protein
MRFNIFNLSRKNRDLPNILFDHIPKCGGTSLIKALSELYPEDSIFRLDGANPYTSIEEFKQLDTGTRDSFQLIVGHESNLLLPLLKTDFLVFSMIRNPVDRVISHYYYALRTPEHYLHKGLIEEEVGLFDYVSDEWTAELSNWYVQHFGGFSREDITNDPDRCLRKTIELMEGQYALIGLLERPEDFMRKLTRLAKFRRSLKLPRLNTASAKASGISVPEPTLEMITNKNQLDIAIYNHFSHMA